MESTTDVFEDFQTMYILGKIPLTYLIHRGMYLIFKGVLSGLRQLVTSEIPLKMIKNAFYFMLKAIFVLKVFAILP